MGCEEIFLSSALRARVLLCFSLVLSLVKIELFYIHVFLFSERTSLELEYFFYFSMDRSEMVCFYKTSQN